MQNIGQLSRKRSILTQNGQELDTTEKAEELDRLNKATAPFEANANKEQTAMTQPEKTERAGSTGGRNTKKIYGLMTNQSFGRNTHVQKALKQNRALLRDGLAKAFTGDKAAAAAIAAMAVTDAAASSHSFSCSHRSMTCADTC